MTLEQEIEALENEIKNSIKIGDSITVRTGKHNKPQARRVIKKNGVLGINLNYEFVELTDVI